MEYQVDERGIIRSPGKFEGEQSYIPYFWDAFMNGMADDDDGTVLSFRVTPEDKALFPKLRKRKVVRLYERDDGFVIEL